MQFTEAKIGRVFVLRLHDGDHLPDALEIFAAQNKLKSALCFFIGGAKKDSRVVVGPKGDGSLPVEPALTLLSGVSEVCGVGTIFTNENGKPTLHMHASFGRGEKAITGCLRKGVDVWLIGEVIMLELTSASVRRVIDKETGFELLETGN
jgi:predicted DNA-binding protein with PD1-like motif